MLLLAYAAHMHAPLIISSFPLFSAVIQAELLALKEEAWQNVASLGNRPSSVSDYANSILE